LIPIWHYTGAAVATFSCYLFMMVSSYLLGQKYYPIPYAVKKLISYITLVVLIYIVHFGLVKLVPNNYLFSLGIGFMLFVFFTWFVSRVEAKELAKLPVVGKYFTR
jgi:O-antigen/teichoic acid export membrane protein